MSSVQATKPELPREEKAIIESVTTLLGDKAKLGYARLNRIKFAVEASNLIEVARFARDNLHFDHCTNVTGTDFPKENQIQVDYHFGSIDGQGLRRIILTISCKIPSADPKIPSLINEYPSADLHERETAEMLGVVFVGHPNLSRLLLPEDWEDIPPLLKKYRLPGRLEGE
jgi:NADH:ubiquinone oxidoreductase subunit C